MKSGSVHSQRSTCRPPVIALHCSGAGASQWHSLAEALGGDYEVLAPEHYGAATSGAWTGEHSFTLADDAAAAIALVDASQDKVPIDTGTAAPMAQALLVNLVLMSIFAIQHSVMARPRFKQWWTKFVPPAVERSTYVLLASLALAFLLWQWRPMPAIFWHVANPSLAMAVTILSFVGWAVALASTFLINHFELFGLQQVANNFVGQPTPALRFRTPLFYKFVRHPLYLGFIIAFWATPTMTVGHLLFAAVTTAYILVGVTLEERDLIGAFGNEYRDYRKRVAMLIPWRKSI